MALVLATSSLSAQDVLDVDTYVNVVLTSHPRAAEARAVASLVAREARVAGALPDPILSAERRRATPFNDAASAGEGTYSISQTLPWPNARAARVKAAEAAGRGRLLQEVAARWDLALDARLAYWRLVHARRFLEHAQRADSDAAAIMDITTRRADVGEVREADRSRATAERLRTQMVRGLAEREAGSAEKALRALALDSLPSSLELRDQAPGGMSLEDIDQRRAALRAKSPALRLGQSAVEREAAAAAAARAGRIPDLDLTVSRGRELDKRSWGVGASLRIPLWNGGRAEVARAEASAFLERSTLARLTLEVGIAFDTAVQQASGVEDRLRFLSSTLVPTAKRTFELVRLSYEEGETSLLDLLDAQRTLRESQVEESLARFDAARAWIEVERLSGPNAAEGDRQ